MADDNRMLDTGHADIAEDLDDGSRGFKAPGTALLLFGTFSGAIAAYLFQVFGIRTLGEVEFAPIAQLWTIFFILVTVVLIPLEQYVTREAARGRRVISSDRSVLLTTTLGTAAVGGLIAFFTRDALFDGELMYVVFLVLLPIGYATLTVGKGVLSGHREFGHMGWVLFWEGVVRLSVGFVLVSFVASAISLGWAMVAAPLAALGTRYWRFDRATAEVESTEASGFLGAYIAGSGASQLLLAGAPLGIAVLGGGPELVSIVFVMFTLYRAPLTLIYSLQGRILPFLVKIAEAGGGFRRIVRSVVGGGLALSMLGGVVGWYVGPQVVELLFDVTPDRFAAAFAAAGVVAASGAQVAGQALVALGGTGRLAIAWVAGLAVAVATMPIIGLAPDRTVALAFALGELTALATVAVLSLRSRA